ncbi:MAG: chromosomal replication initiator protein DnaA [Clostridia bacterium]|nr:chromosomal replication initiator protein DnaA [Clostridia bacterium]
MLSIDMLWSKALRVLEQQLTSITFENWIASIKPVRFDEDGTLVLLTETEIHRDTLERFYSNTVAKSLKEASGEDVAVRFVISTDAEPAAQKDEPPRRRAQTNLNERYTFDTFVKGESNRFAYAAAFAVAESPFNAYNPLFIYGGVGLGKTHLMQAIGHYIASENPDFKILYTTSENFINDVVFSIGKNDRQSLQNKYRSLDVLLIDDIQFIGGKDATELEFFNVFNDLKNAGKQIIITSDKPPKDVPLLEERLKTRIGWGLVVDIQAPDFETRLAILKRKASEEAGVEIEDAVLSMIAERINTNIRDIEGCFNRIVAYTKFINKPMTASIAENVLKDFISSGEKRNVSGDLIKQVVCDFFDITAAEIESSRRDRKFAYPRQIAMYLARNLLDSSYQEIGMMYGNRHYSTVMHACEQIENLIPSDDQLKKTVEDITARLNNS